MVHVIFGSIQNTSGQHFCIIRQGTPAVWRRSKPSILIFFLTDCFWLGVRVLFFGIALSAMMITRRKFKYRYYNEALKFSYIWFHFDSILTFWLTIFPCWLVLWPYGKASISTQFQLNVYTWKYEFSMCSFILFFPQDVMLATVLFFLDIVRHHANVIRCPMNGYNCQLVPH